MIRLCRHIKNDAKTLGMFGEGWHRGK
jgi:hypothetical protein